MRIGQGYDIHKFSADPNRPCVLGAVTIPDAQGLEGHSDADVLCHAIADAIFGALGEPDIGYWFAPGDPQCKNIDSVKIVQKAAERAAELGFVVLNVDSTVVAEVPKIRPYVAQMRERLSAALRIDAQQVGIKATTNETLGALGRKEGIAALACALLGPAPK